MRVKADVRENNKVLYLRIPADVARQLGIRRGDTVIYDIKEVIH